MSLDTGVCSSTKPPARYSRPIFRVHGLLSRRSALTASIPQKLQIHQGNLDFSFIWPEHTLCRSTWVHNGAGPQSIVTEWQYFSFNPLKLKIFGQDKVSLKEKDLKTLILLIKCLKAASLSCGCRRKQSSIELPELYTIILTSGEG